MDVSEIKQRTAAVWGLGDYTQLSQLLRPAAAALADACAVSAGQEVLDVGAGDGNFALACAFEGASVVAADISPGMVERGRARSEAEGYDIEWVEGDAEDLPFEDDRFDCVGSAFGAFIAPRPEVAARELFRVTKPGGTVGMTVWTPNSFTAQLFEVGRRYAPPPEDVPSSLEWGEEGVAQQRFEGLAGSVVTEVHSMPWAGESPERALEAMSESMPPQIAVKRALSAEDYERMQQDNLDLLRRWNSAEDGTLLIENEFLVIVARKPG